VVVVAAGVCAYAAVANRPAIREAVILVMMYSFSRFRHRDNPVSHEQKTAALPLQLTAITSSYRLLHSLTNSALRRPLRQLPVQCG
jgi:hypothetical protein